MKNNAQGKTYRYDAFISYRHCEPDKTVAAKLHTMLETYKPPKAIAEKNGRRKIDRVFRDREELPTSSNLSDDIKYALENSKCLIVICSTNTPKSKWVEKEIKTFMELHGPDNIMPLLIEGEPEEAFPAPLLNAKAITLKADGTEVEEPLEFMAADLRTEEMKKDRKLRYGLDTKLDKAQLSAGLKFLKTEKLRILAPMLNCEFDDLKQRQHERTIKMITTTAVGVSLFFGSFGSFAVYQNRVIAAQNNTLSTQNSLIEQKNKELENTNSELKKQILLTEEQKGIAQNNAAEAIKNADLAKAKEQEAISNYNEANRQKNIAKENERIALAERNKSLENESLYLATASRQQLEQKDRLKAMDLALQGLPKDLNNPDRPISTEAGGALLSALYSGDLIQTTFRHRNSIKSIVFSPDDRKILTMEDKYIVNRCKAHVWDAFTGKELLTVDDVDGAEFSKDSKSLLVYGGYCPEIYDIESGKLALELRDSILDETEYSPDGSMILASDPIGGEVSLWNTKMKQYICEFKTEYNIAKAKFCSDDKNILTISEEGLVQLWNFQSGKEEMSFNLKDYFNSDYVDDLRYSWIQKIKFDFSNYKMLVYDIDGNLCVFNFEDIKQKIKVDTMKEIKSAEFSSDGKSILTLDSSGQLIRIWNVEERAKQIKSIDMGGTPLFAHLSRDNNSIIAGIYNEKYIESLRYSLSLWDIKSSTKLKELCRGKEKVEQAVLNYKGTSVIAVSNNSEAILIDMERFKDVQSLSANNSKFLTYEFNPDGSRVLTSTEDGTIQAWDPQNGKELLKLQTKEKLINAGYIEKGKEIFAVSKGTVNIFNACTGSELISMEYDKSQHFEAISQDGKKIATTSFITPDRNDKDYGGYSSVYLLNIWDVEHSIKLKTFKEYSPERFRTVIFSSDEKYLLASAYDDDARLWNLDTGSLIAKKLHRDDFGVIQFSSDNKIMITHDTMYSTQFTDVETGKVIEKKDFTFRDNDVVFTEDCSKLIEISNGDEITIWDAQSDKEISKFELKTNENEIFPCDSPILSRDGKRIMTNNKDGICLWDADSGIELSRLHGYCSNGRFSPDSRKILMLSDDSSELVLVNLDIRSVMDLSVKRLKGII